MGIKVTHATTEAFLFSRVICGKDGFERRVVTEYASFRSHDELLSANLLDEIHNKRRRCPLGKGRGVLPEEDGKVTGVCKRCVIGVVSEVGRDEHLAHALRVGNDRDCDNHVRSISSRSGRRCAGRGSRKSCSKCSSQQWLSYYASTLGALNCLSITSGGSPSHSEKPVPGAVHP